MFINFPHVELNVEHLLDFLKEGIEKTADSYSD